VEATAHEYFDKIEMECCGGYYFFTLFNSSNSMLWRILHTNMVVAAPPRVVISKNSLLWRLLHKDTL